LFKRRATDPFLTSFLPGFESVNLAFVVNNWNIFFRQFFDAFEGTGDADVELALAAMIQVLMILQLALSTNITLSTSSIVRNLPSNIPTFMVLAAPRHVSCDSDVSIQNQHGILFLGEFGLESP
jgi:hypothetical protein